MAHEETSPLAGYDFVAQAEIDALAAENAAMLERHYYGRLSDFRAQVGGLLRPFNPEAQITTWATYEVEHIKLDPITERLVPNDNVAIIMTHPASVPKPEIRVVTLTEDMYEDRYAVFSREVAVLGSGVSRYVVNLFVNSDAERRDPPRQRLDWRDAPRRRASFGTVFKVNERNSALIIHSPFQGAPPAESTYCDPGKEGMEPRAVYPNGRDDCLEDRSFALAQAQATLDAVKGTQPKRTGHLVLRAA